MNDVENYEKVIEKIDKMISSIKKDISEDPDDKISHSSLRTFEAMKKKYLFKIELEKDRTLEEELQLVQKVIVENKALQKQNPYNKKELKIMLKDFEKYENQLLNELKQFNHQNDINIKMETKNF